MLDIVLFFINEYVEFNMVDSKPIVKQINELQNLAEEITNSEEPIFENFQVSNIIGKLPSS